MFRRLAPLALAALLCAAPPASAQLILQGQVVTKGGATVDQVPVEIVNPNNGAPCLVGNTGCPLIGGSGSGGTATNVLNKQVANNTTSFAVCASACTLYGVFVQNNSATIAYLKLYNATQGSTTCGSGTPVDRILIPASSSGAGAVVPMAASNGAAYSTALTGCVTTGIADADTTAPAASTYLVSFYSR